MPPTTRSVARAIKKMTPPVPHEITDDFTAALAVNLADLPNDPITRQMLFQAFVMQHAQKEEPGKPYAECSPETVAVSIATAKAQIQAHDAGLIAAQAAADAAAAGGSAAGGAAAP